METTRRTTPKTNRKGLSNALCRLGFSGTYYTLWIGDIFRQNVSKDYDKAAAWMQSMYGDDWEFDRTLMGDGNFVMSYNPKPKDEAPKAPKEPTTEEIVNKIIAENGGHWGEVGDKIKTRIRLLKQYTYLSRSPYSYGEQTDTCLVMQEVETGHIYYYYGSNPPFSRYEVYGYFNIEATIKAHSGTDKTILKNIKCKDGGYDFWRKNYQIFQELVREPNPESKYLKTGELMTYEDGSLGSEANQARILHNLHVAMQNGMIFERVNIGHYYPMRRYLRPEIKSETIIDYLRQNGYSEDVVRLAESLQNDTLGREQFFTF